MRSLIKLEMCRYPIFSCRQASPSEEDNKKHQQPSKNEGILSHRQTKRRSQVQNMYRKIAGSNNHNSQICYPLIPGTSRPNQKSVQKYVNELAQCLQNPKNQQHYGENKLKLLKRIIEHYDIKNLDKADYSRLIRTFGLKIQSFNAEFRQPTPNKNFKIKPPKSSINKNRFNLSQRKTRSPQTNPYMTFSRNLITGESQRIKQINFLSTKLQKNQKDTTQKIIQKPLKYKLEKGYTQVRVNKYRQFIYIINLANNIIRQLNVQKYQQPLKYYVGKGNNANLIKSVMRRRFWFQQTNNLNQANFIWTQIKIQSIYKKQQSIKKRQQKQQQIKIQNQIEQLNNNNNFQIKKLNLTKKIKQEDSNNPYTRILTNSQQEQYKHTKNIIKMRSKDNFIERCKYFKRKLAIKQLSQTREVIIHNHFQLNGLLGNKKAMFYMLRQYYKLINKNIFNVVPLTYHIKKGLLDQEFKLFMQCYNTRKKNKLHNYWIIKPGQFSNRGQGITCTNKLDDIKKRVMQCKDQGIKKSLILQLYLTNPLLYNARKFDIRVYFMITCNNGKMRGYWYQEGYVRTSSYIWTLADIYDKQIHLTNDAIQKHCQNYGKYEAGNKLTFNQLQRYLDTLPTNGRNLDIKGNLLPQMKKIAKEAIKSTYLYLDPQRKQTNFQIFGLDFMIDDNFKPWLIQINTNPCLQLSSPVLQRIIPYMLEHAFRIGLDTIFPPPTIHPNTHKFNIPQNALHYNKFQLIFDEDQDGPSLANLYQKSHIMDQIGDKQEDKQQYIEDGQFLDLDNL